MWKQRADMSLELILVVFVAVLRLSFGSAGPPGVAVIARQQPVSNIVLDDHLVFHSKVTSLLRCARLCSLDNGCLTFTFTVEGESGGGDCRGHGQISMASGVMWTQPSTELFTFIADNKPSAMLLLLEAEEGTGFEPATRNQSRNSASGAQTVRLTDEGDRLTFPICLPWEDRIQVAEVRFSFSGSSRVMAVYVDSQEVGTFATVDRYDETLGWNRFDSTSGPPFQPALLTAGPHNVHVVLTDLEPEARGIEIDYVVLGFGNLVSPEDLACL